MELSVVTTLYRSQRYVKEFYQRMVSSAEEVTSSFEIIFVDDGSPDNSAHFVKDIALKDNRVVLVQLSRNFGHHYAIMAGLSHSVGNRIFLIDSDMEDQPELLQEFWKELDNKDFDVVYGIQEQRQGGLFKKLTGNLFYRLFNLVSEVKIPENPCTVRLMNRNYVGALLGTRDKNLFLAGNFAWTGFKQKAILIQKSLREGKSSYKLSKMLSLFLNAITSFSAFPLRLVFYCGLFISIISGFIGCYMLIKKILNPLTVQLGYSSIMVSIWFLGGLTIFFIGIIGIYLSKIFTEVKERPQYIISGIFRGSKND